MHSIRWRIVGAYLLAIIFTLCVIYVLISGVVENYLIKQTASKYNKKAEQLAVSVAPLFVRAETDELLYRLKDAGSNVNGRALLVDNRAVVQVDGFSQLNGMKLSHHEVLDVLYDYKQSAYGFHQLSKSSGYEPTYPEGIVGSIQRFLGSSKVDYEWVMYSAAPVVYESKTLGAIMLSIPIEDVVAQLALIRWQMVLTFFLTGVGFIIINILLSGTMIRPIQKLTEGIRLIGQGDFSKRVEVSGKSEMAQMATTFNQMSERLENLDRSRNEFVANASHELKTPMSTVKILVETLLHQEPMDEAMTREFLKDINSEIDRMSHLVSDLLSLVRQDEGQTGALNLMQVDVTMLIMNICDRLDTVARQRQITIRREIESDVIMIGDRSKLMQAFANLIDNAVKYSMSNSMIHVRLNKGNRQIHFEVQDNGIGIAEENIPYIFDRFYRVDKARSRQTGGTGLGLSIVKSIILLHKGTIHVDSVPDVGTTMTVKLPDRME